MSTAIEIAPIAPLAVVARQSFVEAFLSGRSAATVAAYRQDLGAFASFAKAESIEAACAWLVSLPHGDANAIALYWRNAMIESGLSPATVNRRLAALRSVVKVARTIGVVSWSLEVEGVKSAKYRDTRGCGREGVVAMLARVEARGDAKGARDAAMLHLLFSCALRRNEVLSLDVVHFDAKRSAVSIKGKGRTEREWVTLPSSAKVAVEAWLSLRGADEGPLFVSLDPATRGHRLSAPALYKIVRVLGAAEGFDARPHGLRHAAITEALEKTNGNVRAVQRFSRHRDVNVLTKYDDNRSDLGGQIAALVAL